MLPWRGYCEHCHQPWHQPVRIIKIILKSIIALSLLGMTTRFCTWILTGPTSSSWIVRSSPPSRLGWLNFKMFCYITSSNYQQHRQGACLAAAHFGKSGARQMPDLCPGQDYRRSDWWAKPIPSIDIHFQENNFQVLMSTSNKTNTKYWHFQVINWSYLISVTTAGTGVCFENKCDWFRICFLNFIRTWK